MSKTLAPPSENARCPECRSAAIKTADIEGRTFGGCDACGAVWEACPACGSDEISHGRSRDAGGALVAGYSRCGQCDSVWDVG